MEGSGGRLISVARGCLEPLMTFSTLAVVLTLGGLFFLARGLAERSSTAYLVLGGLVTLGILVIGVILTVGIISFAYWMQGRSEAKEQARFIANTKENLALMQMTAKAQAAQNNMLLRQAREAQKQLPAPGDTVDMPHIEFDDAIFDELEMGD
jgi:Flp pilus assembly protein TadB